MEIDEGCRRPRLEGRRKTQPTMTRVPPTREVGEEDLTTTNQLEEPYYGDMPRSLRVELLARQRNQQRQDAAERLKLKESDQRDDGDVRGQQQRAQAEGRPTLATKGDPHHPGKREFKLLAKRARGTVGVDTGPKGLHLRLKRQERPPDSKDSCERPENPEEEDNPPGQGKSRGNKEREVTTRKAAVAERNVPET
jgi:hypothetical protein